MKKLLFILFSGLLFTSCVGDFPNNSEMNKQQINENVKKVFGTTFDKSHNWTTTTSGIVSISNIPSGAEKIQLLAYVADNDTTTSLTVLNEANVNGETMTLAYDIPGENLGLFAAFVSKDNYLLKAVKNNTVSFARTIKTRGEIGGFTVPDFVPVIGNITNSYASERYAKEGENNLKDEKLYGLSDYSNVGIPVSDYDIDDSLSFRALIFSYFKNGREYNNLPLVKLGGYYNEHAYPITTGLGNPIIVSPVYKSDKATRYGIIIA